MVLSTRASVRIADLYFDEPIPPQLRADIVRFNQSAAPVSGAQCIPCATILIDLSASEDELLSRLKSHTRWKIRRTDRDELRYDFSNDGSRDALVRFADHLDRCRDLKQLPPVGRKRLSILAEQKLLDLSFVSDPSGEILCASSYLITPGRIRGLWAGAFYRSTADHTRRTVIGRANRLLYWRDMLRFKAGGVRIFDFGGYYTGSEDEEKLRINAFKEEFGGTVRHEFNCEIAQTLKGKLALWATHRRDEWSLRRRPRAFSPAGIEEHGSSVSASV